MKPKVIISISIFMVSTSSFANMPIVGFYNTSDQPAAHLEIQDFKNLLEEDKIISVSKAQYGELEGTFINITGETNRYGVGGGMMSVSPFLTEAIKSKGIQIDYKVEEPPRSDNASCYYWDFEEFILYIGLPFSIVMQFITLILVFILFRKRGQSNQRADPTRTTPTIAEAMADKPVD